MSLCLCPLRGVEVVSIADLLLQRDVQACVVHSFAGVITLYGIYIVRVVDGQAVPVLCTLCVRWCVVSRDRVVSWHEL
jgi:hypothetical protein